MERNVIAESSKHSEYGAVQDHTKIKELKMLVLSRKKDEKIILKGPDMRDIMITIVRIDNKNKVRIGIEADKEITVLRSELDSITTCSND